VKLNRLFMRSDVYVLTGFGLATVAMFPLDRHLASVVHDEDLQANRDLMRLSSTVRWFGGQGPYLIGGGMYVLGRVFHSSRAAELAVHGTEAVVVGNVVSGALKIILGRARPYTSSDTNPRNFGFGRGLRSADYQAFPSGHATTAFAAAAAVAAETLEWWPRSRWIFRPILYGGAALVGLSRMYDDKHWASDVVMGAAVGTFAGLKVVRFNHTHVGNRLDRWLLGDSSAAAHIRMYPGTDGALGVGMHLTW
jgi:membrane-associated phospholipid phosphatase